MEQKKKDIRAIGVHKSLNMPVGDAIEWAYLEGLKDGLEYAEQAQETQEQEKAA